jgi:DNA (cytosine-5)-methyltransferase 1
VKRPLGASNNAAHRARREEVRARQPATRSSSVIGGRQGQSAGPLIDQPAADDHRRRLNKFNAIVAPFLKPRYGEDPDPARRGGLGQAPRVRSLEEPMPTIVPTGNGADLVAAFLVQSITEGITKRPGAQLDLPLSTVTTQDHHHLVTAHIKRDFGTSTGAPVDSPLPTITSDGGGHASFVASFLTAYYGNEKNGRPLSDPMPTVVSKDRLALVTVNSVEYVIVDIGMRMLIPRELYRAQGFPDSYKIDIPYRGKLLPKTAQVRMVGNSVPPEVACAILRALFRSESEPTEIAA